MNARRALLLVTFTAALVLLSAGDAMANMGGQGCYGEASDLAITTVMFAVLAFFPAVICLGSFVQWRLDKRRHARQDAESRRSVSAEWSGGW